MCPVLRCRPQHAFTYKATSKVQQVAQTWRKVYSGRSVAKAGSCAYGQLIHGKEAARLGRSVRSRSNRHLRHSGRNHSPSSTVKSEAPARKKSIKQTPTTTLRHIRFISRSPVHRAALESLLSLARQMFAKAWSWTLYRERTPESRLRFFPILHYH